MTELPGIDPVDTLMTGRDRVTCAYLVRAPELTLVEAGPATSSHAVVEALRRHGVGPNDLAHLVLTHIHLDHAGGAAQLAEAFPRATLWIHEGIARHLADPTRLIASAERIYGKQGLRERFGLPQPVPEQRIRGLADGDVLALGGRRLEVLHTPGHSATHIALQDVSSGAVFTGDAVGVHLPGSKVLRPAAPPPEFDLEQALQSIGTIRERARGTLLLAHFGAATETDATCDRAQETLRRWAETVRPFATKPPVEAERALSELAEATEQAASPEEAERYEIIGSVRLNALGLHRYWRKRAERDQPS